MDPIKQLKELAVCEDGGNDLVAVTIDMSKVKDPATTLEKAIKAGDLDASILGSGSIVGQAATAGLPL